MKNLSKTLLLCAVFAFVFASCNQANTNDGKNTNSDKKGNGGVELKVPEITKITVNEKEITDKRDWFIAVENTVEMLKKENIKINVLANGKSFTNVSFLMLASESSSEEINEIALKEGEAVSIFLKVLACDSYKELPHTISVMREKDSAVQLVDSLIKVHEKKVENGEVEVAYAISSVKAGNVEVTFNVENVTVQIKNADKDGEVKLEEGKKTSVVLTVDAVKGKHGSWEKEIFVIREKNKEAKLQVESLNLYGGMNDWGTIAYDTNPTALKFNAQSNSWEADKPNGKDAIKFNTKIKAENVEASKITAKLFKGFLRNGTVEYADEETNNAVSGTPEGTDLIVFNFDNTNCKNSSVQNYYKIEFFIEGNSSVSAFIKLK